MHAAIQLATYWAFAFLSLGTALVLLNIYFGAIDKDFELRSPGSEAALAGVASFIEALGLWLVVTFIPLASRALILPVLIVALIYKVAHYEDWGRVDVFMLLVFQAVIVYLGVSLFLGNFQMAIGLLAGFGFVLTVIAFFARSLWG